MLIGVYIIRALFPPVAFPKLGFWIAPVAAVEVGNLAIGRSGKILERP